MKKILLFIVSTWLGWPACAQKAGVKHLYQISATQARELYQAEENGSLDPALFSRLVEVFPYDSIRWALPAGHYLMVSADGEQLLVEQRSVNQISVVLLNNERDLSFRVIDSAGHSLPDLEARFRKKRVPYDAATGTYRLKKCDKEGLLEIRAPGDTSFYYVDAGLPQSLFARRYRRFSNRGFGYLLTTPVRWGAGIVNYFRRGFGYGEWNLRLFPHHEKRLLGYIALSQPKYRPADTVRVKAHLADHRGKPWEKEARLTCSYFVENYRREMVIDTFLAPQQPGVFVFDDVPAADWPLDQRYSIELKVDDKRFSDGLSQSFEFEDYQLDAVRYRLTSLREQYTPGEAIILEAEARDYNGLAVPDVFVRLVLLTASVEEFYEDEMWIPDTLWRNEQALSGDGPTAIAVPDSLLPAARMDVDVQAFFVNSNGELQEEKTRFTYDAAPLRLDLRLEKGDLVVEAYENGKPVQREAQLEVSGPDTDYLEPRSIQLPHRERLNPNFFDYWISCGDALADLSLSEGEEAYSSGIQIEGVIKADSVLIEVENPHRIPVVYLIQTEDGEVAAGQFETVRWTWRQVAKERAYFVRLQYIWGGEGYSQEQTIRSYDKRLDIKLEAPERIILGNRGMVNVKVQDAKGRPAGGVDMVLGTLNNQFGDPAPFAGPVIRHHPVQSPLTYNQFYAYPKEEATHHLPLSSEWLDPLDLEDELLYQIRYPERGIFLHRDTVRGDTAYQQWAQLAPFLVRNGKVKPLYMIYCNGQLLYYYGAMNQTPYSFPGRAGENRIVLRGRDYEYTLEGVRLEEGQKLILAIDEDRFGESPGGVSIRREAVPKKLTDRERRLLRQSMLVIRRESLQQPIFIWEPGGRVHRLGSSYSRDKGMAGPFTFKAPLRFVAQGKFARVLSFEPGYEYVVQERRDKLYAAELFEDVSLLPENLPTPRIDDLLLLPSQIDVNGPPKQYLAFQSNYQQQEAGKGAFECLSVPSERETSLFPFGAVLQPDDGEPLAYETKPMHARFPNVPPGEYRFYLFYPSGFYLKRDIRIRPDTLLFLNLVKDEWVLDSHRTQLERFFFQPPAELSEITQAGKEIQQNNPYQGNEQLITGRVQDENGEPLIGAVVQIAKTKIGAVTDFGGAFSIWLPYGKNELIFSYVGYLSERREISERSRNVNVTLEIDQANLQEVVVTGYATSVRGLTSVGDLSGIAAGVTISSKNEMRDGSFLSPGLEADLPVLNLKDKNREDLRGDFRDLAAWHPYIFTDERGEASFSIQFPDNITRWKTFALGMDEEGRGGLAVSYTRAYKEVMAQLKLPRFLVEGDRVHVIGKSLNYTSDSLHVRTSFARAGKEQRSSMQSLGPVLVETLPVVAPGAVDSLTFSYRLEGAGHADGEDRSLPVFPRGVEEYKGHFAVLRGDTSLRLSFDPNLGSVTLIIRDNVLDLLLEDLVHVQDYPYHCNEQTASRLLTFLMEKQVRSQLGQPFGKERELRRALARLRKSQHDDGGWGWWPDSPSDTWMTIYVLRALHLAREAGYPVPGFPKGILYLQNQIIQLELRELLLVLELFSNTADEELFTATEAIMRSYDGMDLSLYDRLLSLRVRQAYGLPYELDSLYHYRQSTVLGGQYWPGDNWDWQRSSVSNTLLAYEILKSAGREEELFPIQQFLLSQRGSTGWGNTFESARVLSTILPDLLGSAGQPAPKEIVLDGAVSANVRVWPYQIEFDPSEELIVHKKGSFPLFLTTCQRFQNRDPEPRDSLCRIRTHLRQAKQPTAELSKGQPAELVVDITTDQLLNYAMIEVPIPAGCSYFSKIQPLAGSEVHREYLREKTVLFCRRLPAGEHRFIIALEPRFSGWYTLNPAVARPMYFPAIDGRNEVKRVMVR